MLKKILIGLAAVIAIFSVIVALQPSDFRIARSATIDAPPEQVFTQVNDFHKWEDWSPWAKLDPNAKATFDGSKSGEGAVFAWDGNSDVGKGKMTLTESKPHERIKIRLDFLKPMEATSDVQFTFEPEGKKTNVTWAMEGTASFIEKAICLVFFNRDEMVGGMYEKGLQNLEVAAKAAQK